MSRVESVQKIGVRVNRMNALKELARNLELRVEDPTELTDEDAPQFCIHGHHPSIEVHDNRKVATAHEYRGSVALHGFHKARDGALYVSLRIKKLGGFVAVGIADGLV